MVGWGESWAPWGGGLWAVGVCVCMSVGSGRVGGDQVGVEACRALYPKVRRLSCVLNAEGTGGEPPRALVGVALWRRPPSCGGGVQVMA